MLLVSNFLCFVELIKPLEKKVIFFVLSQMRPNKNTVIGLFSAKGRKYKCDVLAAIKCI